MNVFKDQGLGSTHTDSQGEKVPKHVLEGFVEKYKNSRMPLNQAHDLGKKNVGYIENFRLTEDQGGEWVLIADVYYETKDLETALGGFSISYLEKTHKGYEAEDFIAYLPFPNYNDSEFIQTILNNKNVAVGKWVKKGAEPTTIALIGAVAVFILKPVWEDLYKTQIAPKIYSFFASNISKLKSQNISADLIQTVNFRGNAIQVVLIPARGSEENCFTVELLNNAMELVHRFLYSYDDAMNTCRVHLYFHDKDTGYKLHRVELKNGEVIHYA